MTARVKIIFKTPFYSPIYAEFYNPLAVTEFIQKLDFMQPHVLTNLSVGRPEFQLGTQMVLRNEDAQIASSVSWGPRFLIGRSVRHDGKRIYATVPVDAHVANANGMVTRQWREIQIKPGEYNAVLEYGTMRQLWPRTGHTSCEYRKFLTQYARKKMLTKSL